MSLEHPLDGLLDAMLPSALQLVGAVRARDPEWVSALTNGLTRDQVMALLVAVAAMVPDDQPASQLLLWTFGPDVTDQVYGQLVLEELDGRLPVHEPSKRCTRCERYRPLTDFHRGTVHNKGGRKAQCKDCIAELRRERINRRADRPAAAASETDVAVRAA